VRQSLDSAGFSLGLAVLFTCTAAIAGVREAKAADLNWKGYAWNVTNGGMAGVANGSPANVSVDADGYLHLRVQKNGSTWTAAEIFTTNKLGFGSYQWQLDGPIDTMDKNVVLGLFPYGPAAGIGEDGTNEIDIEYSRWGQANGPNGDWTNYPASGSTIGELSYTFSLSGGTLSTSRFIWTKSSIEDFLLGGLQPVTSTAQLIKTWKYAPQNPSTNIPQQALPLGINLWCFDVPSDGKNVEIVIRDFQFVAEGAGVGGTGGTGGNPAGGRANTTGGAGSNGGTAAQAGASPAGGGGAVGGARPAGGTSSRGGTSNGGAASGGRAPSTGGTVTAAGMSSSGGVTSSSGGVTSSSGGVTSSSGGVTSSSGGVTSSSGGVTSSSGGQGAAASSAGEHSASGAGGLPVSPEPTGCSIRGTSAVTSGREWAWLSVLSLVVGRRLRRRGRR
jgi:hypothetical protein